MKELALNNCRLDGRYDIQNLLGRGSYAEIYVASDTLSSPQSPHHLVVIKALNVFLQNDLDTDLERTLVENFQNEAIALDRVRHPNIISRLGHGTARDLRGTIFHYLVLEYLPGGDLARLCRKESLSLADALNYIEQVCSGLNHAHKLSVIHRDIKPQNLLLTEDRKTVKIADFGVARISQADSPITRVGTDVYAAPEHSPAMVGNSGTLTFTQLTPAADIFSLAKSAYVLITGESPRFFAGREITELPFAVRQEDWADELLKALNKATQVDPRERFQTVKEFWLALSPLKRFAENSEAETLINKTLSEIPQPGISKGYSPLAPERPTFNTSRDLKIKKRENSLQDPSLVIKLEPHNPLYKPTPANNSILFNEAHTETSDQSAALQPRRKPFHRVAGLAIFLILFAGSLFATYNYLSGRGFFSQTNSGSTSAATIGTAITDVNLRPSPSSGNEPIGLVTKNSRVRIVGKQNNWYEVDIIEHGRPKENSASADRGWVYGKFIETQE